MPRVVKNPRQYDSGLCLSYLTTVFLPLLLAYHSWKRERLIFLIHGFIVGEPLDGVLLMT